MSKKIISWQQYFMGVAKLSAYRSKDPNTQVGACIVSPENKIVGVGYNGLPWGCEDDQFPWAAREGDLYDTKYPYVVHAELNAILNSISHLQGCTIYVSLFPCHECVKAIIQSGIKEIIYEDDKYKMNLMTEIAAKEEFSGLDAVSELLKDKDIETNEQGRRLLEQYGYWGNKGNAFYSQFRHQVMVTGAVSTVICVLLLTFLLYWKKKEDACHQKILDQLEEILIRFRENKFDDLLKTENHAELEKLNDQLEAIGHHIQLIKEEARAEKENTKEMVSDISHQLKTPVAALDTCFSVLMQNDLSATEQEEFRIRCRSALDGLETLLQSLLEISKMETGLIQINKKKLPLMDTVISAVNRTYPKADEKEIEFVFDYEKELETCMVMQDKRWLGEAVINVLDNAIKYSPDGSKIFIRLQKRNDLVRMEIEDQGIGIPQNEYHKIFQRFYRGSSKEVMEKSGTGIGLFLSREIIEKHAGTITVTSGKKKKGSTFVIQLPYVG